MWPQQIGGSAVPAVVERTDAREVSLTRFMQLLVR
jgi:hypothetical protein